VARLLSYLSPNWKLFALGFLCLFASLLVCRVKSFQFLSLNFSPLPIELVSFFVKIIYVFLSICRYLNVDYSKALLCIV